MNEFKIFLLIVGGTCQKQPLVPIICEVHVSSCIVSRQLSVHLAPWHVATAADKAWVGVYE